MPDIEGERSYVAGFLHAQEIAASAIRGNDPPAFMFGHDVVTVGLDASARLNATGTLRLRGSTLPLLILRTNLTWCA